MSWLSKAFGGNVLQAVLDPAGTAVRALTHKGDTSTSTVGDFLDPAGLGAGKFTDSAIGGGQLQGKLNTSDKNGAAPTTTATASPAAFNPFAQFGYTPGIGYTTGANGANPFAGVAQSIPQSFFRNPQAFAALLSILSQQAPQSPPPASSAPAATYGIPGSIPADSTPGPAPSGTTMYNSTGGFGNGGGSMNVAGNNAALGQRKWSGSPWVRAL